jgi:muramoyltetrapeptide carboxypeptidase
MKDTDRPYGQHVYEIIHHYVKNAPYPVCFNFPVSHENENYALKIGAKYKLQVTDTEVFLEE